MPGDLPSSTSMAAATPCTLAAKTNTSGLKNAPAAVWVFGPCFCVQEWMSMLPCLVTLWSVAFAAFSSKSF